MRRTKAVILVALLALSVLLSRSTSTADDWNRATTAIFNQPVEIPGMVLEPGIYVFKLPEVTGNHNIVQIWNADQTVLYATVLCWTEYWFEPPRDNVFVFEEREKGAPMALQSWFHRGNPNGEMFIYPKRSTK